MNLKSKISTLTVAILAAMLAAAAINCQNNPEQTPTATLATTPTATATEAYVPPTLTPTRTPAPELAPTQTPEPTPTRTPVPPSATPSPEVQPTPVPTPAEPTSTIISQPTATPISEPDPTVQPTPSVELRREIVGSFGNDQYELDTRTSLGETYAVNLTFATEVWDWDPEDQPVTLNLMCQTGKAEPYQCAEPWTVSYESEPETLLQPKLPRGFTYVSAELDGIPIARSLVWIKLVDPGFSHFAIVEIHSESAALDAFAINELTPTGSNGLVARVTGYWSDGSADIEIFADAQTISPTDTLTCFSEEGIASECNAQATTVANGRYTRFATRLPVGKVTVIIAERNGETTLESQVHVNNRIMGVNPTVLECFTDATFQDANLMPDQAIGCAGWYQTRLAKWNPDVPFRIRVDGPIVWSDFFRAELAKLQPLLNINFEWTSDDPDLIATVGITHENALERDLGCAAEPGVGGCASTGIAADNRHIVIYNLYPDDNAPDSLPTDSDQLNQLRGTILHEAVHAFTGMGHRIEIGTAMHSAANEFIKPYPTLNPMDEALIELHARPEILNGMSLDEVKHFAIPSDQLRDAPSQLAEPVPGFFAWQTINAALQNLRNAPSASYDINTTMPGCQQSLTTATYQVANLRPNVRDFQWSRLQADNTNILRISHPENDPETWSQTDAGWQPTNIPTTDIGWIPEWSDPYFALITALLRADWNDVTMAQNADGTATITTNIPGNVGIELTIHQTTNSLTGYRLNWNRNIGQCEGYTVTAANGRVGTTFAIPPEVQANSSILRPCTTTELPLNPRAHRVSNQWLTECPAAAEGNAYERKYRFTTDTWSLLRLDFQSQNDAFIQITDSSSNSIATIEPTTEFRYLVGLEGYGNPINDLDPWQFRLPVQGTYAWHHQWLPPGTYDVQAIARNESFPGRFTLIVDAQPIADSPDNLRFKAVATSVDRTCALTTDGTPLCWGRPHDTSANPTIPQGKFDQIFGGYHYCATTDDGTAQCWDFKEAGNHECSPNEEVANREVCNLTGQPSFNTEGLIDQAQAFVSGFYYDQSAPGDAAFSRISAGRSHTCGLQTDNSALCWGLDFDGESTPPAGRSFTDVASSSGFSCGLIEGGQIECWGSDGTGEIITPTESGFQDVGISFAYGETRVCALDSLGQVQCFSKWEWSCDPSLAYVNPCTGDQGDWIGPDDPNYVPTPPDLYNPAPNSTFVALSTGAPECGIKADGTAECWHVWPIVTSPPATETFTQISAGKHHACGVRTDGTIACWGENAYGQSTPPNGTYFPNLR